MSDAKLLHEVPRRTWAVSPDDRITARILFFDENWSRERIAAHLGRAYMTIRNILKEGEPTDADRAIYWKAKAQRPDTATGLVTDAATDTFNGSTGADR